MNAGARVIMNAGKMNFSRTDLHTGKSGNLKKSFAIKLDRKKAIALAGFKRPQGAAAHLVDIGTVERYTKKGYYRGTVQKRGPNTGSRFYHDAVEAEGYNAMQRVMDVVFDEILRITGRG